MAPGQGGPVCSPQSNRACGSTPLPSGTPTTRRRVPRRSPAIKGPRVSPSAHNPPAPRLKGPRGKGLSRGPGRASRRSAGRAPTPGPGPAPPAGAAKLGPNRSRAAQNTRGSLTMQGKPPGFPQAGHKALSLVEEAERYQERLSAPPSWTRPSEANFINIFY
ncbi:hypothetical protein NDU88_002013 [Pleurodeles waltl]|uniref:Uncharacterized protein n=1 Tax=Pleurodeles waltl TaxID=8319 RepID=A0AAV7UYC8_PLEWA|nr:hypothetical protein NDU88_002013 [Pleurodeles waltl]